MMALELLPLWGCYKYSQPFTCEFLGRRTFSVLLGLYLGVELLAHVVICHFSFKFGRAALWISVPWPGVEPVPQLCKHRVLTTGPPGSCLFVFLGKRQLVSLMAAPSYSLRPAPGSVRGLQVPCPLALSAVLGSDVGGSSSCWATSVPFAGSPLPITWASPHAQYVYVSRS